MAAYDKDLFGGTSEGFQGRAVDAKRRSEPNSNKELSLDSGSRQVIRSAVKKDAI